LIVGPSLESVSQASQAPIATATSGTIQMTENRRERRVEACGRALARRDYSWPYFRYEARRSRCRD
jgi:hypothetical protein